MKTPGSLSLPGMMEPNTSGSLTSSRWSSEVISKRSVMMS